MALCNNYKFLTRANGLTTHQREDTTTARSEVQ
jgi:hypothetical protein